MKPHWLNRQRLLVYPLAVLVLYLGWIGILVLRAHGGVDAGGKPLGFDFIAFWGASRAALAGHAADAYDPQALLALERTALPGLGAGPLGSWQYPPTFLLLVLPLGLLPYFLSWFTFIGASFAALAASVRGILRSEGLAPAAAWLPLLACPAVMVNAVEGQNGFLTAALAGGALLLLRSRPALAGVLIALLSIKPHLGLLLPLVLICGRYWRVLFYAAAATAGFVAASLAILGVDTLSAFFERLPVVANWVGDGTMPLAKMPTLFSLARSLGMPLREAYWLHGLGALLAALATARVWLKSEDLALRGAALLTGTLLVSPYLYDYDLVWLTPALAWFAGHAQRLGWRRGERELLVLAWLLPLLMLFGESLLKVQPAPLVTAALLLLILRRSAEGTDGKSPVAAPA